MLVDLAVDCWWSFQYACCLGSWYITYRLYYIRLVRRTSTGSNKDLGRTGSGGSCGGGVISRYHTKCSSTRRKLKAYLPMTNMLV
jgi:hypothetical protein